MIDDLDKTLEALLQQELPAYLASQVAISFAIPDGQFPPASVPLPAIDLFLYDVRENLDLRRGEWTVERRSDGTASKKRPLTHVDCSYLITAWPSTGVPNPAQDEHRLLGEVIKALLRHRVFPAAVMQGSLKGQEPPIRATPLQPGYLQSLGEFWQALGGKPKAAINYTVTASLDVSLPVELGPVVLSKGNTFREMKVEG